MYESNAHTLKEIFDEHSTEDKISIFNQILNSIISAIDNGSLALLDTELATQQINYFLNIISDIDRTSPEVIEIIDQTREQLMLMLMEETDQQTLYINMVLNLLDPPHQESDSSLSPSPNITEHHEEDLGARMRSATFDSNVRFYADNNIMSCSYDSCDFLMAAFRMKNQDDDPTI